MASVKGKEANRERPDMSVIATERECIVGSLSNISVVASATEVKHFIFNLCIECVSVMIFCF